MSKPLLFIDVDDTLICKDAPGPGFNLRPGVITQLAVLSSLFDCFWLTHWKEEELLQLWKLLYARKDTKDISYFDWKHYNASDKAIGVLALSKQPDDHGFYWLEDPLSTGNLNELSAAGVLDNYIPVEPHGLWGFTRACQTLFDKASITEKQIEEANGKLEWFQEPLGLHFDWTYYK